MQPQISKSTTYMKYMQHVDFLYRIERAMYQRQQLSDAHKKYTAQGRIFKKHNLRSVHTTFIWEFTPFSVTDTKCAYAFSVSSSMSLKRDPLIARRRQRNGGAEGFKFRLKISNFFNFNVLTLL